MTRKPFLMLCASVFLLAGIASAKTYHVTMIEAAKAGTADLKPGEYEIKLEGSQAVFIEETNSKSFTVPVKVEHESKKFGETSVETADKDGAKNLAAINLGGSDTRLVFGQ